MSDSGAPASTSAAETASVRGVVFGMGERRGVHHDAGHEERRERAVALVERRAEPDGEQRRHLAGRRGGRVDPVGRRHARRSRRGGR